MRRVLIVTTLLAAAFGFSCTARIREAAYGAPYTDITKTSTEPGAYGAAIPYYVIDQHREGQHVFVDVNVVDAGRLAQIAPRIVNEKKGDATAVTLREWGPDERPPHPPARTVEWTADRGFTTAQ